MSSLEQIANELLAGTLTPEEAEKLTKQRTLPHSKRNKDRIPKDYEFSQTNGELTILNNEETLVSRITYSLEEDPVQGDYIHLSKAESFEKRKGHFNFLLEKLRTIGEEENCSHILLEVDRSNDLAMEIYERKGFYYIGDIETSGQNTDRIFMRKDLFYGE